MAPDVRVSARAWRGPFRPRRAEDHCISKRTLSARGPRADHAHGAGAGDARSGAPRSAGAAGGRSVWTPPRPSACRKRLKRHFPARLPGVPGMPPMPAMCQSCRQHGQNQRRKESCPPTGAGRALGNRCHRAPMPGSAQPGGPPKLSDWRTRSWKRIDPPLPTGRPRIQPSASGSGGTLRAVRAVGPIPQDLHVGLQVRDLSFHA